MITRIWVDPSLKEELDKWKDIFLDVFMEQGILRSQDYQIESIPFTSQICAEILKKMRKNLKKKDIKVKGILEGQKKQIVLVLDESNTNKNLTLEVENLGGKKGEVNLM